MGIGVHFEGVKAHNFAFLGYFKKVYGREKPLPKWKFALSGALVDGLHLGGIALKYSKATHGVVLATGFVALCGAVLGSEVAEHRYQLYNMDKQGANLRFIYWWDKVAGNKKR
uniref:Uncharacterized protein n=1 Tax=Oryza punctata TaxID=4537 RepID=A0A0E0JZF7_ORYPU